MMCPLRRPTGEFAKGTFGYDLDTKCLQKECVWWDNGNNGCSMLSIVMELMRLQECIDDHK